MQNDNAVVPALLRTAWHFHRDFDLLTIGMVNDMFAESRNDDYKYWEIVIQVDFDDFT